MTQNEEIEYRRNDLFTDDFWEGVNWPSEETRKLQLEAAKRLWGIAQGDFYQSGIVARFLLGLYNGPRYPFTLTDLRALDGSIHRDCLAVLQIDYYPVKEIHLHLGKVNGEFHKLAKRWGLTKNHEDCDDTLED